MSDTLIHRDQIGRMVVIPKGPQRIVSLVPSQTELLFDLGLNDRVAGITKFCIHPEDWFRNKARVGGTKQLHLDTIESLQPDLIIANKEENNREDIERLEKQFPVWVSDVNDLESAIVMIREIGKITGVESTDLLQKIRSEFDKIKPTSVNRRVLYLIWKKPYMAAGSDTFVNDMLRRCGLENVVSGLRYPELTESEIADLKPDLIFLSSEPFPFGPTHMRDLQGFLPNTEVILVDGEMFSWYGSRLKLAAKYLNELTRSIP